MKSAAAAKPKEIVEGLKGACPDLFAAVDRLATDWLQPVIERIEAIGASYEEAPRAKHVNDPVWGTFELEPHEVLLIDSPLIQRLRGVKQLGLANLVFPGANHDRFEHLCGTVESAERVYRALEKNLGRRVQGSAAPPLDEHDRLTVRLAALLHDVGHGPFSHAIEPVIAARYAPDLKAFNAALADHFSSDAKVAIAELISVLIILSGAMERVLGSPQFAALKASNPADLQLRLATLVMGARSKSQQAFLSAIISGQVDCDKLDYMTRDALHSGMPIEFDTGRLLWKLEIVRCTPDTLPADQTQNREFAEQCPLQTYFDIGIAASGVGALEQMLIGRAFLYDRLYHHHKVRAADAMAQRMLHYSILERGTPFELDDLYQPVSDDSLIRILSGRLSREDLKVGGEAAKALGNSILNRDLYVRAFAFRAAFHTAEMGEGGDERSRMSALSEAWSPVSTGLADIDDRIAAENAIVAIARRIGERLGDDRIADLARRIEPRHVIVDLAENRVKSVTINVHTEDGILEAPTLFFDPQRWSHVYDLQKRTGFVFCDRAFVILVGLATKIFFFEKWGYAVSEKGDRLSKMVDRVPIEWVKAMEAAGEIDADLASVLKRESAPRTFVHETQIVWPSEWFMENGDVDRDFVDDLRNALPQGLAAADRDALVKVVGGLAKFVQAMHLDSDFLKSGLLEKDLQNALIRFLRARDIDAVEGSEIAAGETDVLAERRILIENKIAGQAVDPRTIKPNAPYQAHRYSIAICARLFVTLIAYRPKNDADPLRQTSSIIVETLEGLNQTAVNIRVLVPYGIKVPSAVKKPKSPVKQG